MFEKEAEEYATRDVFFDGVPEPVINHQRKNDWKNGAEFGYNKANEWHFVKDGKYPKEYADLFICYLTEDDAKDCVRGWYEYDLDNDEHYFKTVNTFGTAVIKNVYAWKEIVLPELKESE